MNRNSRSDGLPALPLYRSVPHLPLPKENVPLKQHDNPVIKKKSSLGAFKFKNFFQIKPKDSSERPQSTLQSSRPAPNPQAVKPDQAIRRADSYSTLNTQHKSVMAPSRPLPPSAYAARPRLPLIATSAARINAYTCPESNETFSHTSPDTLPYMSGAGDGWNTPFPAKPDMGTRQMESTGFPFPPTQMPRSYAMERLAAPSDVGRHERAPSAAFEYQEFETSLRNSGRLSSILGGGDSVKGSDKENDSGHNAGTSPYSLKSRVDKVSSMDKHPNAKRGSGLVRSMQSLEQLRRSPLIETPKPLSIGRNYPRNRPLAMTDSGNRDTLAPVSYGKRDAKAQEINLSSGTRSRGTLRREPIHWESDEEPRRNPQDTGMDSFGDAGSEVQDLAW
jgi:hypothetical protein